MFGEMVVVILSMRNDCEVMIYGKIRKKNYDEWRMAWLCFFYAQYFSVSFAFYKEVDKFSSGEVKSGSFVKFFRR